MPPVDIKKALEILEGNERIYACVAKVFLDDIPLRITKLANAVTSKDLETVSSQAHSIKSAALSVGAQDLYELLQKIELASAAPDKDACKPLLPLILSEFELVTNFLNAHLQLCA